MSPSANRNFRHMALFLAATSSLSVQAATVSYSFTECLTHNVCSGSAMPSVATLTISEISQGLSFTLSNTAPVRNANTSFISGLFMNGSVDLASSTLTFATGQTIKSLDYSATNNQPSNLTSAQGYNWDLHFDTARTGDRFLNGETLSWTLTGSSVQLSDFATNAKMMVHVQGLTGGNSEKIAATLVSPIPEPETYALFLAGLGLMSRVARRRSHNDQK